MEAHITEEEIIKVLENVLDGKVKINVSNKGKLSSLEIIVEGTNKTTILEEFDTEGDPMKCLLKLALDEWAVSSGNGKNILKDYGFEEGDTRFEDLLK